MSAGKVNEVEELKAGELLQNVQRILKPIRVINPFAEHLVLPESVFKPRRTNSHYLQFIEAVTFYKQLQRTQKVNEETGELFIETEIEDIKEANELITEVLLRKSDMISGACRNYFETLKAYLTKEKQTTFTNREMSKSLRKSISAIKRYHLELLDSQHIKIQKKDKLRGYLYELSNPNEYMELESQIQTLLAQITTKLEAAQ